MKSLEIEAEPAKERGGGERNAEEELLSRS